MCLIGPDATRACQAVKGAFHDFVISSCTSGNKGSGAEQTMSCAPSLDTNDPTENTQDRVEDSIPALISAVARASMTANSVKLRLSYQTGGNGSPEWEIRLAVDEPPWAQPIHELNWERPTCWGMEGPWGHTRRIWFHWYPQIVHCAHRPFVTLCLLKSTRVATATFPLAVMAWPKLQQKSWPCDGGRCRPHQEIHRRKSIFQKTFSSVFALWKKMYLLWKNSLARENSYWPFLEYQRCLGFPRATPSVGISTQRWGDWQIGKHNINESSPPRLLL